MMRFVFSNCSSGGNDISHGTTGRYCFGAKFLVESGSDLVGNRPR